MRTAGYASRSTWSATITQRQELERVGTRLGITSLEGWYQISLRDVIANGGGGLMAYYGNSLFKALRSAYPDQHWIPWLFRHVPITYWHEEKHRRTFFDWVAEILKLKCLDDWYGVTMRDVANLGGSGLLAGWYDSSLSKALTSLYPQHTWRAWKFSQVPSKFWCTKDNQLRYFAWLGEQLNIKNLDDWYNVTVRDVHANYGGGLLLNHYQGSIAKALASLYPEHNWKPWKFTQVPAGHWDDTANQRDFFASVGSELGVKELDDWYNVTATQLHARGGSGLMQRHRNSISTALSVVYPSHEWRLWNFSQLPKGFWDDDKCVHKYLGWLMDAVGVAHPRDLNTRHMMVIKKRGLITKKHAWQLSKRVMSTWPDHSLHGHVSKKQKHLQTMLQEMGVVNMMINYKHPRLFFSHSGKNLELDVFLPSTNIAFEFQGKQHYTGETNGTSFVGFEQQHRDDEKQRLCHDAGIRLVRVPYWWDGTKDSLATTLIDYGVSKLD